MARKSIGDIILAENRDQGYFPGDANAHRAAQALADRFDAPTIIALTNALTFTQEMGGQFWAVTLRERVGENGELVAEDQPGEYQTVMLRFEYESRDARIAKATTPPDNVGGAPVSDFGEAPTRIEVPDQPDHETYCYMCGRKNPTDRPDDPPCECQDAEKHPDSERQATEA